MAEKKLRVHTLAKELGVASKAIIEKCRAEDIEVKNHMHVVHAGLAATIREWFSEGAHTTTLEQAERVNLAKVRVKTRRKKKTTETAAQSESGSTGVAVLEAPAGEAPSTGELAPTISAPGAETSAPTETLPPAETQASPGTPDGATSAAAEVQPASEETVVAAAPEATAEPSAQSPESPPLATTDTTGSESPAVGEKAAGAPPKQKAPIIAGPQNVPQPAKLQGPRVVRMERPDDIAPPRRAPRPPRGPGRSDAASPPISPEEARRGPRRPPGRQDWKSPGAAESAPPGGRRSPRRSVRDTRALSVEKLREWRDRDLVERRERLDHATGRGIGGLRAIEGKQPRRSGSRRAVEHVQKSQIELDEPVMIKELSKESGITVANILRKLFQEHGQMKTAGSSLDTETAQVIAAEFGIELTVRPRRSGLDRLADEFASILRDHLMPRPPIVTVLGHVDHGKTSLLDRIRKANVVAGESGGITQHIGAYRVAVQDKSVTFLDTPGHTAFTAMRARGANITDVVVLVVAADDGVMPTTVEAINHAKAANATIVVALNKIDLPHDINKIYAQLSEQGLTPSGEWGGDTDVVKTSAVTGEGIDDLLNHLAMLSEIMDLEADPTIPAHGTVIEAQRKEGEGNVARLLIQEGTLRSGQFIVCGAAYGRARTLKDERRRSLKTAAPSTPVEVTGLTEGATAGDPFYVVKSAQRAKEIGEEVAVQRRELTLSRVAKPTNLESVLASAVEGAVPELQVILKADVHGSVDALKNELSKFPKDRIKLNILHAGVGAIIESDVVLAQASNAIIIGFHVVPDPATRKLADDARVSIRTYRVIYAVVDDIRKALEDQLPPEEHFESRGRAEVREVFTISKVGRIAGCLVRDGAIARNHLVRVVRDGVVVVDKAPIESLRRFKDDAKEIKSGLECGIRVRRFDDLKPGDIIEAYEVIQVAQTLE